MTQEGNGKVERGLVVVAHPDDAEFMAAGTIAKWVAEGIKMYLVVVTDGSKGSNDPNMSAEELIKIRRQEQLEAAEVLGISEVEFLGYPDAYVQHTIELRRDITRAIRKYRPDRLITMTPYRSFGINSYLNHPDHLAVGDATLAAVYPSARDRLTFPELAAEGLEPYKVREVYITGTETPDCWIDITDTINKKIESLKKHRSQVSDRDLEKHVKERAAQTAEGHDMQYAEAFKVFYLS
ncbi:LmbE family protein [Thermobaculum terrenum ATCC BAA-798]|uniref:LmbE family protein n=1 Tax=Thermobaculum terrenum (strain ATCC BAA-798 / CCMEE 7001 / YNP1) TaxID=525904 RepID=D1CFP8_THET1|nr:PIG-L deacetylase family protein [Thermobaculum terrenum]ACZ41754.1 LmbE family protein [Thermobaculum terrenum ATCC BAA-798]